jgi:predicted permease
MGWSRFFRRRFWHEERGRELEAHLQIETDENIARGMAPDEARAAALRRLGNLPRIREEIYAMNTIAILETLVQDLRYGLRQVRHHRGFTAVAVLTLALGIGSATVMYSVIRNVLLDPFPYRHSSRMVDVVLRDAAQPELLFRGALLPDEFLDFQEQTDVFSEVAGADNETMIWSRDSGAEPFSVVHVTPNTFQFLGVPPLLGRALGEADARPDAPAAAVLSHRAWHGRLGSDPAVIGRTIVLNDRPHTVVGVMPPRFAWHVADAWVTDRIVRGAGAGGSRWFQAHLKPGVTLAQAEAQIALVAARRAREHPDQYPKQLRIQVIHVIDWVVGRYRSVLYTLFAAVGLLLLIACANVASMLLARATARESEMTVRAALGAGRARIVRQLLVESLLLALLAAAAGALLAYGGLQALVHVMPRQNVPWETEIRLDQPVLLFSLATAVVSVLVFGLWPALQGARRDLLGGLRQGGKGLAGGSRSGRVRSGLVVAQVALSLVLLLGAGLMMRTFVALVQAELGFDPANVVMVRYAFPPGQYEAAEQKHTFSRTAVERVRALPGVTAAAESAGWPPPFGTTLSAVEVVGQDEAGRGSARVRMATEDYVRVLGLRLLSGRALTIDDVRQGRRVALVNEALVRSALGGASPLGRSIRLPILAQPPDPVPDPTFEIVGVLADVRNAGIRDAPSPEALVPSTTRARRVRVLMARTTLDPALAGETIRRAVTDVDRGVSVSRPTLLETEMRESFQAQPRFTLIVLAAFAVTGLVLVALGIYGVLAYVVSRQRQEIAVRMALGAGRGQVVGLVVRLGMRLVAGGILAGAAASLATNQLIASQLWSTTPRDPVTFAAAIVVLVVVGLVACLVPAVRAVRVDPMAALRSE